MLLLVAGGVSNVAWLPPPLLPWELAGVIQTDGPGGLLSSYFITPSVAIQQRCKNVRTCKQCLCKMFLAWVKFYQNFTLFCRKSELCPNFVLFGGIFWHILELNFSFWLFFCTICYPDLQSGTNSRPSSVASSKLYLISSCVNKENLSKHWQIFNIFC